MTKIILFAALFLTPFVLFLDEGDALYGKRKPVKGNPDRYSSNTIPQMRDFFL